MYSPGTIAANDGTVDDGTVVDGTGTDDTGTDGTTGLAVRSVAAVASGGGAVPAAVPVIIAGIPGGMFLPCRDDPDLFFAESPEEVELAKSLCRACPARRACLAGALERKEPWGVWGGELFLRGEVVPRKRPRGRPRKAEEAA